jgi:hypothetical protein
VGASARAASHAERGGCVGLGSGRPGPMLAQEHGRRAAPPFGSTPVEGRNRPNPPAALSSQHPATPGTPATAEQWPSGRQSLNVWGGGTAREWGGVLSRAMRGRGLRHTASTLHTAHQSTRPPKKPRARGARQRPSRPRRRSLVGVYAPAAFFGGNEPWFWPRGARTSSRSPVHSSFLEGGAVWGTHSLRRRG